MLKRFTAVTIGILFLVSAAGYAVAGQGKGSGTAIRQQVASQTKKQSQKQLQVDKKCNGPQIKTQTRTRTSYDK